jgi:S-ribosylhomocysteine lyase
MERITSFSVDHRVLQRGIYVSRIDNDIITYDIRMTTPNKEAALDPKVAHAIEHIGATLLRNGDYKEDIIYFGPMGCMTGFYLIVKNLDLETIISMARNMYQEIAVWEEEIPGAKEAECGNYQYMDLVNAKQAAKSFVDSPWQHVYHKL